MRDPGLLAGWGGLPSEASPSVPLPGGEEGPDAECFRRGGACPLPRPERAVLEQPGVSTHPLIYISPRPGFLPRKGQRHVAWGVSPRKEMPDESPEPRRGDGKSLLPGRLPSPLRGSGLLWDRLPGADAPGYMPLPLPGQKIRFHDLCIKGWVSTPGTGEPSHRVLKGRPTAEVSAGPSGLEKLSVCHPGLKPRAVQSSPFQGEGGDKPLPYEKTGRSSVDGIGTSPALTEFLPVQTPLSTSWRGAGGEASKGTLPSHHDALDPGL